MATISPLSHSSLFPVICIVGSTVSYCEMLTRKRKEAEKSVIVAFSRGSSVEDMFKSMQEIGGKIVNSIYYKARDQVHTG